MQDILGPWTCPYNVQGCTGIYRLFYARTAQVCTYVHIAKMAKKSPEDARTGP